LLQNGDPDLAGFTTGASPEVQLLRVPRGALDATVLVHEPIADTANPSITDSVATADGVTWLSTDGCTVDVHVYTIPAPSPDAGI
jgi:hypothetical protein